MGSVHHWLNNLGMLAIIVRLIAMEMTSFSNLYREDYNKNHRNQTRILENQIVVLSLILTLIKKIK